MQSHRTLMMNNREMTAKQNLHPQKTNNSMSMDRMERNGLLEDNNGPRTTDTRQEHVQVMMT